MVHATVRCTTEGNEIVYLYICLQNCLYLFQKYKLLLHYSLFSCQCLMLIFNLAVTYAFFIEKFKSWWRSCFRNTNCCLLHYTMLSTVVPCCSKKRCTVLQLKLKTIAPKKINAHTSTPHVIDFQHILILFLCSLNSSWIQFQDMNNALAIYLCFSFSYGIRNSFLI